MVFLPVSPRPVYHRDIREHSPCLKKLNQKSCLHPNLGCRIHAEPTHSNPSMLCCFCFSLGAICSRFLSPSSGSYVGGDSIVDQSERPDFILNIQQ
jgi:hypothetical protein